MKRLFSALISLAMVIGILSMASCTESPAESSSKAASTEGTSSISSTVPTPSAVSSEDDKSEESAYGDALTALLENTVDLMDEQFASFSEISVTKGFDWTDTSSAELGNEAAINLFDGDTATKWCCGDTEAAKASAVVWSMKEAVTVTHYTFTTANDNAEYVGRNPIGWRIYGTNDELSSDMAMTESNFSDGSVPAGWILLDEVVKTEIPNENFLEYGFAVDGANQGAYKSYMLLIDTCDTANTVFQMSEITLYGAAETAE